jgi:hypothetical protein
MCIQLRLFILTTACSAFLAVVPSVNAQQGKTQMLSHNPYQHIDDLSRNARDYASVEALFHQITESTFFGPYPDSISSRMCRMELNHIGVESSRITERSVADAVNYMGKYLGGSSYTGTNALQVHLLRIAMYPDLPHLLKSPTPHDPQKLVGPDLTPAGGAYIALLVLRQKLTNPNWFGDPDAQNQVVLSYTPDPQSQTSNVLRVEKEPALSITVRQKLARDLKSDSNGTVVAFQHFLDLAGFDQ